MNTPKHASDAEIDALFELLLEMEHDPFEQRRKHPAPAAGEPRKLTTVETNHEVANANG